MARHFCSVAFLLAALAGCRAMAPPDWTTIPLLHETSRLLTGAADARAWQRWGQANLQSGDVLFVRGESRIFLGLVNFSELSSQLADSPFSHVAIVARENEQLVVYDVVAEGTRRTEFADFVADRRLWTLAAKRLRPEYQAYVPSALAYCRQISREHQPFDEEFQLDNDRLYCTELIEKAFRQSGLALSEPVPIDQLPGYERVPAAIRKVVLAARSIEPDQAVFVPGNETIGLWSSPCLEPLLEVTDINSPPATEHRATGTRDGGRDSRAGSNGIRFE